MPVLDAAAVGGYKKRAKIGMLWRAIRWQLLGMAAVVALVCLGREWSRAANVGGAAIVLGALFGWLVIVSDLQWVAIPYNDYRGLYAVPPRVAAAASNLISCGVSPTAIGVEYLKNDPILFVEDAEQGSVVKRYDLIVW